MRFEGKSEVDAADTAARALGRRVSELRYQVVRDERSFWGGRVVEIEVEDEVDSRQSTVDSEETEQAYRPPVEQQLARPVQPEQAPRMAGSGAPEGATSPEAWSTVETTLTELLSAAGFLVEVRRREGAEMLFELIGDDVEPLLANKGEGLGGLEVLTGRIAGKRLGHPVYPRLDAEGFRAHQRESLEELARRSAEEAKRTRRPQLLPPLPPGERRLVHLALAQDPDVETESEGEGFLKRVAVRPKAS